MTKKKTAAKEPARQPCINPEPLSEKEAFKELFLGAYEDVFKHEFVELVTKAARHYADFHCYSVRATFSLLEAGAALFGVDLFE
jgi:hypothetical protein